MRSINIRGWLLLLVLAVSMSSMAQFRLTADATQNFSNFNFIDSTGIKDNNYIGKYVGAYDVGFQVHFPGGLYFLSTIGMRRAGATYEVNNLNYDWDLQYAFIRLGLGYFHMFESIGMYVSAAPYYGALTRANQRLNDQNFSLRNTDHFANNDFGISLKYGLNIPLTNKLSANTGINYTRGFMNLETAENNQITTNYAIGLNLGVAFNIN